MKELSHHTLNRKQMIGIVVNRLQTGHQISSRDLVQEEKDFVCR